MHIDHGLVRLLLEKLPPIADGNKNRDQQLEIMRTVRDLVTILNGYLHTKYLLVNIK